MKKKIHKSMTMQSVLVIILISVMSLLGFGEQEIAKTYDQLGEESKTETTKELITVIAAGGAAFGRWRVKDED